MTFIGFVLGSGGVNLLHCVPKSGIPCTARVLYITFPHCQKKLRGLGASPELKLRISEIPLMEWSLEASVIWV